MISVVALLGLDGRDDDILAATATLVARRPTRLTLVHVSPESPVGEGEARSRLSAIAARVGAAEATVCRGEIDAIAARVSETAQADLLVIGRTAAADGKAAWGEHGRSLLRAPGCPVLVVPAGCTLRLRRAAVGMDLSPSALDAFAWAGRFVDEVEAVAVVAGNGGDAEDRITRDALAAQLRAELDARGLPSAVLRTVVSASPADALLARAADVDLLCVGSRGLSPLAAVLLGSTAERLAARSTCPVLVVRRQGGSRGVFGALFGS